MISVIIPIYNAERYLNRMLDNLLAQNFMDYECLLIDDGSTDRSYDICSEYAQKDTRFRYIQQGKKGVSAARNCGIKNARGEYIAFLDADDEILPNYLQVLFDNCQQSSIAVCDVVVFENGKEIARFTEGDTELTQVQALNSLLSRSGINSGPAAKLYKKSVIQDLKFPMMHTYEDLVFSMNAFSNADKIVSTSKTQYHYILHSTGTMASMEKNPSVDIIIATEKVLDFIASRSDLDPKCFYITISHLLQYALPMAISRNYFSRDFIDQTQRLYRKHFTQILMCKAIPWKEKIVFFLFSHGWVLQSGRKINRLRKEK